MELDDERILMAARRCLELEMTAIKATSDNLGASFQKTVRELVRTVRAGGKLVFCGVGKNAPIGAKLAGTFNSIGVPSTCLDALQALHGDLGLCTAEDLVLLLSNSGETEDILRLLPLLKRLGCRCVGITSEPTSTLARHADFPLPYTVEQEACPLNLAPTASTTCALALGDALAMVSLEILGVTAKEYARYHPGGSLGQRLLLRVSDIMRTGAAFAIAPEDISVREALLRITRARCGLIALVAPTSGKLSGVFSDGDFRRASLQDETILTKPVRLCMTPSPKTVRADAMAVEALRIFEQSSINDLVVVDAGGCPVGLLDGQDLPKLKIV
jgi:arabinose-5-phosphate isomerase